MASEMKTTLTRAAREKIRRANAQRAKDIEKKAAEKKRVEVVEVVKKQANNNKSKRKMEMKYI